MHDRFWWAVLYLLAGLLTLLYVWVRHGYPGSYWSGHYANGFVMGCSAIDCGPECLHGGIDATEIRVAAPVEGQTETFAREKLKPLQFGPANPCLCN